MASGNSAPQAKGKPAITVNADNVRNLQVADRLINIRPTDQHGPTGPVRTYQPSITHGGGEGLEYINGRPCRITQTDLCPVFWIGSRGEAIVTNEYIDVSYHLNSEAVDKLLESNCDPESVQEALGQCLAALEWSSDTVLQQKLTSFKLTLIEDKLPRLLQAVLDLILNESSRGKVIGLIKQAFHEFGALLKMIKISSLTFVFQHTDDAKADEMLGSDEAQGRLIAVLYRFLPEWVCVHARWEVQRCEWEDCGVSSACDSQPVVTWRMPLSSSALYEDSQTKEVVDVEKLSQLVEPVIERSIERALDRAVVPLHDAINQMHRVVQTVEMIQKESSILAQYETVMLPPGETDFDVPGAYPSSPHTSVTPPGVTVDDVQGAYPSSPQTSVILPGETDDDVGRASPSSLSHHYLQELKQHQPVVPRERSENMSGKSETMPEVFSFGAPGDSQTSAIVAFTEHIQEQSGLQRSLDSKDPSRDMADQPCPQQSASPVQGSFQYDTKAQGPPETLTERDMAELGRDSEKFFNRSSDPHEGMTEAEEPEAAQECEESTTVKQTSHEGRETGREEAAASTKASKTKQAEDLLLWVNVKSQASQSKNPEIMRMMEQVELALQKEETPSPIAKAMDTVMVLDTSDSVAENHLDELKAAALAFVDGIEENVETMNLEENLAVIQMGGRAWVRQHLTNDYNRVREAIDALGPDSELMPTGGRTALFQTLVVCLGAIEGRGGVISVAGCHHVRPRLVFFTDGRPTDEETTEVGPDMQSKVDEVKFALVQLISEFVSKKHKTTPMPIFWVPVGTDVDMVFLESMAKLGGGLVVGKENIADICRYYKVQQTIGCVYKLVRKNKDVYDDEQKIVPIINALAGNLKDTEKAYVLQEVVKKYQNADPEDLYPDDFHNVFEDTEWVKDGHLLPLGTRVVRGPDWKWSNQDSGGPGTVLQHNRKRDKYMYVMWDTGHHNTYRYALEGPRDVQQTDQRPRIARNSESLDIGVEVTRGDDWKCKDEDGNSVGVVIRIHKRGKVKVRWSNGHIGSYRFAEGRHEVKPVISLSELRVLDPVPDEELGAVGGFDPAQDAVRRVWQWWEENRWKTYEEKTQDKLLKEYTLRKSGSCIIERDGIHRRMIFKKHEEKTLDTGAVVRVRSIVLPERQYQAMLGEEYTLQPPSHIAAPGQESDRLPTSPAEHRSPRPHPTALLERQPPSPAQSKGDADPDTTHLKAPTKAGDGESGKVTGPKKDDR